MSTQAASFLTEQDDVLANIMSSIDLPEPVSTRNVFHDLMSCILEQQIHYRSTKHIFQKMLDAVGLQELTPANFSYFEETVGNTYPLAAPKYEAILSLADRWKDLPQHWQDLSDEDVRKQLAPQKGISSWTVDMILLFTLQRPDIFPADDYHLKQLMAQLYELDPQAKLKQQMLAIAQTWSPFRSDACRYLWAWKEANKGKKR